MMKLLVGRVTILVIVRYCIFRIYLMHAQCLDLVEVRVQEGLSGVSILIQ